jgi:hypothetical protein
MQAALSDREIARMQAVQEQYLPDLADVLRPTNTQNAAGGIQDGTFTAYAAVPCQVSERVLRQLTEKVEGGRLESGIRWVVVFPINVRDAANNLVPLALTNDDVLRTTEQRSGKQMTLQVNGVQVTESWETAMTVECQLIA